MRSLLEVINESMSYKVYHDNMSYPNDRPHNIYVVGEHISDQGNKEIEEFLVNLVNKLNDVKIPNITGRQNWNYVKTIDCNFDGDIPQTDLNIIKAMFNGGVTFWHNPANILNYSLSNNIM